MKLAIYAAVATAAWGAAGMAPAADNAVYGGFGTTGFVLGYNRAFSEQWGGRIEPTPSTTTAALTPAAPITMANSISDLPPCLPIFYPWHNAWRISAGFFAGNNDAEGQGTPKNTTYTSNGVTYNLDGQHLDFKADLPSVRPYLGVGYGSARRPNGGLGFFADVGVAYGRPDVSLTSSIPLPNADAQARLDEERDEIQNKADQLTWFPVVRVGSVTAFKTALSSKARLAPGSGQAQNRG